MTSVVINGQAPVELVLTQVAGVGPPGVGVPAGGTTGQVLAKTSGTDYATQWIAAAGLGDLLAANNLADLANAATALANIGGEVSGAAATAQAAAIAAAASDATSKANAAQAAAIAAAASDATSKANAAQSAAIAASDPAGSAATAVAAAASSYATAAQGATADTAVQPARTISTTAPLAGGGDLSANRQLTVSAASSTATGVVELATDAEALTGTDTARAVTPANVAYVLARQAEWWIYAVGDDTTAITTGNGKGEFYMPFAFTMTGYRLTAKTGGTVQATIVDINKNGTTTMTTNKLSIDVSEKTSDTAATAAVLTTTSWASGDICTIDFDQVGTGCAGIQVTFYGTRNP